MQYYVQCLIHQSFVIPTGSENSGDFDFLYAKLGYMPRSSQITARNLAGKCETTMVGLGMDSKAVQF